jgi:serine/threonine-protein kinase
MAEPPQVLGERYEIESPLGRGGMATVYRARDTVLGRTVAVKILAERYARDARAVERFRREARAAGALNHPNVVAVYDTGAEDGTHYIVMEHVEGRTLDELLGAGPLPADEAARIGVAVSNALEAAHEKGLVHRDVKPANIILTPEGGVKVADFGIARAVEADTLTQTGTVLGTAAYISPEQAKGDPVGPPSDLYSLGCVLYQMLTGRAPFRGESSMAVAFQHVNERPVPPSKVAGVPAGVEAVVLKAMAKKPKGRFPSAAAMAGALDEAASKLPAGVAAPAGPEEVTTEPMKRAKAAATAPIKTPPPPRGGDTAVMTAPPVEARPVDWRKRRLVFAGIGAAALVAVLGLILVFSSDPIEAPPREPGPVTPISPSSPSPETPTVEQAAALLYETLQSGVNLGQIDQESAEKIAKPVVEGLERFQRGDLEKALEGLDKGREELAKLIDEGRVTPELANQISQRLELLEIALRAAPLPPPPADEEGEGSSDRGRGRGRGHGNGDDD